MSPWKRPSIAVVTVQIQESSVQSDCAGRDGGPSDYVSIPTRKSASSLCSVPDPEVSTALSVLPPPTMSRVLGTLKAVKRRPHPSVGAHPTSFGALYARIRPVGGRLLLVPSACVAVRGSLQSLQTIRRYASGPPGGKSPGGFPGFSMGQQSQKGETLKEYVRFSFP